MVKAEKKSCRDQESLRNLSRSLPMALLRTRETVMERFSPNLRAHDLTDPQWRVLRALFDYGKKDLSELAEVCCLLKPSITRIIRAMEQRSLLEKQRDVKDQRRTIVSITSKGKDLISKVGPTSEKISKQIKAEFGAYELDGLYRRLDLLITKLKKE